MQSENLNKNTIYVSSEIGQLRRLMIHNPDNGLAKVIPSKAQDWLFEDIIHLDSMRKDEYDFYVKLLLFFLDPDKIISQIKFADDPQNQRQFYEPDQKAYFKSDKVIDPQFLLAEVIEDQVLKLKLVSSICAIERCPYRSVDELMAIEPCELAKTLISGVMPDGQIIFPPVPNFIFTRDIGIVINDHILLNRPAKLVRFRESLMMKYIFYNHPFFKDYQDKIIEISDDEHHFYLSLEEAAQNEITLEGGDIMVVHKNHVLVGISERTSYKAVNRIIDQLFSRNIVRKVTVIKIPKKRDFMHIDTVFTQVKRNVWVLFGALSRQNIAYTDRSYIQDANSPFFGKKHRPEIIQFHQGNENNPIHFEYLEDLLDDISQNDFQSSEETRFIYSGDGEYPFVLREQWTDSCNVLAIREGVVIGYDRNTKTAESFKKQGFEVLMAADLVDQFVKGEKHPNEIQNTLILLPSAELSRARGGSHCMSMPLLRDDC
ncbi:MAG: arginine deiminase family protein [Microscillaceae bacterium]|nr:arginine deiminase family protein [Microscillaceae bacterium]